MTMISMEMSQQEKVETALVVRRRLRRILDSAQIAGGYPRDIALNTVKPKDIDIFIDSRYYRTPEARLSVANRIFEAFGQIGIRSSELALQTGESNPYANQITNLQDTNQFECFSMLTTQREYEPLNLIFSYNNDRLQDFDWSICKYIVDRDGIFHMTGQGGTPETNYYYPGHRNDNPEQILEHARRILEKYPNCRFFFDPNTITRALNTYVALQQWQEERRGGESIPQQTEGTTGESLGLQSRVRAIPQTGDSLRATANPRGFFQWEDDSTEQSRVVRTWGENPFQFPTEQQESIRRFAEAASEEQSRRVQRARVEAGLRDLTNGRTSRW